MLAGEAVAGRAALTALRCDTGETVRTALQPTLTDGAVTVRPLRDADVPAMVAACQDPEIPLWTSVPSPYTPEDARRFLVIVDAEAIAGEGTALAVCGPDGRLAGTVGLMGLEPGGSRGEIGYWTAAHARGRGQATRAVALVRDWAQAELGLTALEILAHRDNHRSQRVAERAGFADTGRLASLPRMPPGRREGYKVYRWVSA